MIRRWAKRKRPLHGGDVEVDATQVVSVGRYSDPDDFDAAVEEAAQEAQLVVAEITVADSK